MSITITETIGRAIVRERADGRCEIAVDDVCTATMDSVHHRGKRSHGGAWGPANLLAACGDGTRGCHGYVEAHPDWAHSQGLWLMAGDGGPDEVSCCIRWQNARSWWVLDDEGMLSWDGMPFEEIRLATQGSALLFAPKSSR